MTLRTQKTGTQSPWTTEELKSGLLHFHKENGHYPTSTEIDNYQYLPSARTIERSHGGLVELRKKLGLGDEHDYRLGSHSSKRAHTINTRAHKTEDIVYQFLIEKFGKEFVHREYFFTDDHRTRADFFVYDEGKGFCVDVFYPNSTRNLTGCLNIKLNKYNKEYMGFVPYPVIFLQMNESIDDDSLNKLLKNKKRQLLSNQYLMGWEAFKEFTKSRKALSVRRTK